MMTFLKKQLLKISGVIFVTVFSGMFVDLNAQIAIAVANDENRSALAYQVVWNAGSAWETGRTAVKALEDKGYANVRHQPGRVNHGHDLGGGYWVVVTTTAELYDGSVRTAYGLGASSNSYKEAEDRALLNMVASFWAWRDSYGYRIVDQGTF